MGNSRCIQRQEEGQKCGRNVNGIRKTLKVKNVGTGKRDILSVDLEIEEEEWRIILVYNRMRKREYLKNLEEIMERGGWRKLIIGEDFNARTAEQGSIAWNENEGEEDKRFSKDKIINKQGKDLLAYIEETGLLNGNKQGDEEGDMTFIGRRGSSIIDYAICNADYAIWRHGKKYT